MPFLDWVNKNQSKLVARQTPYRLLKEVDHFGEVSGDSADNMLIKGDNLEALKALIPYYSGSVKCVFIDPPYNTQSAFEHYDDKLEHSQWLSLMYPRLILLRELMSEESSIWVTVDDNESHYLKVMMDEVFGRSNFVSNAVWQKKASPQANSIWLSDSHDHILCYAKNKQIWRPNLLKRTEGADARYENIDNDPRGPWTSGDFTISLTGGQRGAQFAKTGHSDNIFEITTPSGRKLLPTKGRCWGSSESRFKELVADNRIWFGESGNNVPRIKRFLSEVKDGIVCTTVWLRSDVGDNQLAKKEVMAFNEDNVFSTPKPEGLIQRILELSTHSGDLVLDSFLGSGTTAAVAHKLHRRYIGVEVGDHAETHCIPRLRRVIEGEQGGISTSIGWTGGGGFRFVKLGSAVFDDQGLLDSEIKFATLAAHLWHQQTRTPSSKRFNKPFLGVHGGTAYYLLYNGILGDKRPQGGNVLTQAVLQQLKADFPHDGPKLIFGELSRLGPARLAAEQITFRQIPYDLSIS